MLQLQKNVKHFFIFTFFLSLYVCSLSSSQAGFGFFNKNSSAHSYTELCKSANINQKVFAMAFAAHQKAFTEGTTKSHLLTVIDYSKPSTEKRFWVIDLHQKKVIYHTYVSHGSGSGDVYAQSFSNQHGSYQSSIGAFVTGGTYQGRHGRSLNLIGLEPGINHNAYNRRIVIHAAQYVSEQFIKQHGRLGRSWGCPALNTKLAQPIINTIKDGVLLFAYFPEPYWLNHSKYTNQKSMVA